MAGAAGDERRVRARRREQRDVAGHDDDVERAVEGEIGEVGHAPLELRAPPARGVDHRGVGVGTHDGEPTGGQLAGDAAGAAARVEHRAGSQRGDEVGLAVHIGTLRREPSNRCW